MIHITYTYVSKHWKSLLWSSFVTFASIFVMALASLWNAETHQELLNTATGAGFAAVLFRLFGKVFLEAVRDYVMYLALFVKSKQKPPTPPTE